MEIPEYYAASLATVFVLLLVPLLLYTARWLRKHVGHNLNCLLHPLLPSSISFSAVIPRYEAAVFCFLLTTNILYVSVDNANIDEVVKRLGHMALVNLVPISCGAHMNHIASICGIHHDRYFRFHTCLGIVFTAESILHAVFTLQRRSFSTISHAELLVSFRFPFGSRLTGLRHYVPYAQFSCSPSFTTGFLSSSPTSIRSWLWQA